MHPTVHRSTKTRSPTTARASPIASGQDYSIILRRQIQSASPVLKRRKEVAAQESSEDEEVIITSTAINRNMGLNRSVNEGVNMETDMSPQRHGENQSNDRGAAGVRQDRIASAPAFTFADFTSYMQTNFNLDKLDKRFDDMEDSMERVGRKVDRQGNRLKEVEKRLNKLEGIENQEDEVFEPIKKFPEPLMSSRDARGKETDREAMERREYEKARSSLKIFPIGGTNEEELLANLIVFMDRVLGLPSSVNNREAVVSIRRMGQNKFAPDKVLVVFREAAVRDSVIWSSGMLAELVDKSNGTPKAGIRIVVPAHLKSTEKQLSDYGRRIRNKHGKGTKTHIKFDDSDRSIYLNIRLKEDNLWSRVYPEFARDWLKKLRNSEAEKLNRRFNLDPAAGGEENRPRSNPFALIKSRAKTTSWNGHGGMEEAGGK